MVVFTCNNCGDSLQKPKVAKHYQFQCRNPVFLTCVDCLKDFRGEEYTVHTKCVTENERYGGKNYVPEKNCNKGEKKQQAWLNIIQSVLTNSTNLTVPERNILNSISKHENIPRKKQKFMNFLQNISTNRVNMPIAESVWEKMESAFKKGLTDNNSKEEKEKKKNVNEVENQNNSNLSKENEVKEDKTNEKSKKAKKRLLECDENENCQQKIKRTDVINDIQENNAVIDNDNKFSWKNTILSIVTAKGEISLKKLKKKTIAQFLANFPEASTEKTTCKFEKKLLKISDIIVVEDRVKLASC